ncbi:ANTAR domain-containing protein [bacterium]|nr:ANTAR domain-containing protein [bacterium]
MLDRIFRVLLISSSKNFAASIINALAYEPYEISVIDTIQKAKRLVIEKDFDILIINAPVVDDFGIDFAIDEALRDISGVLIFANAKYETEIYYKTYQYGILTLVKPSTYGILLQSLRLLSSSLIKKEMLFEKKTDLKSRLEEIKIINTAKLLLIEHKQISEDEAHKYIEKKAMDFRVNKIKIANEIIDEYYKKGSK